MSGSKADLQIPEAEFRNNLRQFTGTENWYKVGINPRITFTDGVKYVADTCGSYWLIDAIASYQYQLDFQKEAFQVWELKVEDSKGVLTCDDGNGNIFFTKEISFTTFPYSEIELWYVNNVILLKSEY